MSYLELLNQKLKCERLYKNYIKGGITFFAPEIFCRQTYFFYFEVSC